MIEMMKYLFLSLFILFTIIHLIASKRSDKKLRNITKPFLLICLLLFYCTSASKIAMTVVLALIFSWLGDVLLIPKGVKWFSVGGVCFGIGHLFFVLSYAKDVVFAKINPIIIVSLALFFICTVTVIFSKLKKHLPKALFYPMFIYLLINGTMNCFAIFRMLSNVRLETILTCVGAILFFISDARLFFVRFMKDGKQRNHFLVMLTYTVGELLIVLGLLG